MSTATYTPYSSTTMQSTPPGQPSVFSWVWSYLY
jgi:hypothetical protein